MAFEALEDRRLLATFVVNTAVDENNGIGVGGISLREAVLAANAAGGPDDITFNAALSGATILLGGTEMAITGELTIDARALAENVTIDANQVSRIFNITAVAGNFTLAGLNLTRGSKDDFASDGSGGAVRSLTAGLLTLEECMVTDSAVSGLSARGGGISATGDIQLTKTTVSRNVTSGNNGGSGSAYGGGIWSGGDVTLSGSAITGNRTAGGNAHGGGVYATGDLNVFRSIITGNNTVAGVGGGAAASGTVTIVQSEVTYNRTLHVNAQAGGIFADANITIDQSTVSGNVAGAFGGGFFSGGTALVTRSTLSGNTARDGGAAMLYGPATFEQSTVSGNSVTSDGGGLFVRHTVTLIQSTFTENHSGDFGGALVQADTALNHAVTINSSIFAGNTATDGGNDLFLNDPDSTRTVNYTLIGDTSGSGITGSTGTGNLLNVDPQLAPLALNGGLTQTHALVAGSPAIDAGSTSVLFNSAEFDQRGAPFVRVFDGNATPGARMDMGAYEWRTALAPSSFVVTTAADELDYTNANVSLREAINSANGSDGPNTITFAAALSGATINLDGTDLDIGHELTIDARPLAQNVTINAGKASRIFNITAATGDFTLAGLSLTGGRTFGDNSPIGDFVPIFSGGAIRSLSTGLLTLDESTIDGSTTVGWRAAGGAMWARSDVLLSHSTVTANRTTGKYSSGAGILAGGNVELIHTTISGNSITRELGNGGGIRASGSVTLTHATVSGNSTLAESSSGAGISSGNAVTLYRSAVSGNSTAGNFSSGGGISALAVTLIQSTVSGNSTAGSYSDGGGILAGTVTLTESTVSGNHTAGADANGGGIYATDQVSLTHSTLSGNTVAGLNADGGGIYAWGGTGNRVDIIQSTVTNNHALHATGRGGGVFQVNTAANRLFLIHSSIVFDNSAPGGGPNIFKDPQSQLTVNYSMIGTGITPDPGTSGNNVTPFTSGLLQLGDYGGPTQTHALAEGSAALDTGDPGAVYASDQRGAPFVRVFDGNFVPGARIDMGAFERQTLAPSALVVDTLDDEDDDDYSLGDLSLREAVHLANNGSVGADTITFAAALSGQTILLDGGELQITEALTIDATSLAQNVTIDADELSRIFHIIVSSGNYTFSDLTLTGGRVADAIGGAAIRSTTNGILTLTRTIVTANTSVGSFGSGGGIRAAGQVNLNQSTVSGNSTTGGNASGGGIYTVGGMTLVQSTVSGNSTTGGNSRGGGISAANAGATVSLDRSTLSGNSTAGERAYGGGMITSGPVILTNSTVSSNQTTGNGSRGGGISATTVSLTRSTLSGNSTTGASTGSGIFEQFSHGGGVWAFGVTVDQSTVTNNSATHATSMGGGLFQANSTSNLAFSITNSIVSANAAGGGGADAVKDPDVSLAVNYSLIGTGITPNSGGNNIPSNTPLLNPLANNGGPTRTHAPQAASDAIDAGNPAIGFNPTEFDQRGTGFARVVGGQIDIGSYEVQEAGPPSADFDDDGFVTGRDFLLWQIGLGTLAPNAEKADGDADNDLDVDATDLAFWQLQYGGPAPLLAAVLAPSSTEEIAANSVPATDLIDTAIAVSFALERESRIVSAEVVPTYPAFVEYLVDSKESSIPIVARHRPVDADFVSTRRPSSDDSTADKRGWERSLDEAFAAIST